MLISLWSVILDPGFFFFFFFNAGWTSMTPFRQRNAWKQLVKLNKLDWKSLRWATALPPSVDNVNTWTHAQTYTHTRNKTQEPQRCNTNYIFHTMSTTLWYETGPKALNQEKLSTPNWCLNIQNSENAETVLDHQLRVRLLNLSWLTTDYGVTRSRQS